MKKHVFFIGIGGTGLSAIARLLKEKGYIVSGSDQQISDLARDLISNGITVYEGHSPDHLVGVDLVIRSSAISDQNPEVQAAHQMRIPVYKRSDILGELMSDKVGIGIAGTHGKTTTTAMVATMLVKAGLDPSYIIGSISNDLGNNARYGQGKYFVIEADEYDRMFLGLSPTVAVVTNLEHDHPDCFPTFSDYLQAFRAFSEKVLPDGKILVCFDDPGVRKLLPMISTQSVITYGSSPDCDYRAINIQRNEKGGYSYIACNKYVELVTVELKVPGLHNVQNSLAAIAIAHQLDLNLEFSAKSLSEFTGTARRFEIIGEVNQITIIDDYAHHPTEIKATLQAARSRYPENKIWAIWQPHTYSRTQTLFDEFKNSFSEANHVIVSQIYASREINDEFSASLVVDAMDHPDSRYIASLEDISNYLVEQLKPGDVMLVFSAGDAVQISKNVKSRLTQKENNDEIRK
jgi:UDP-N-acetylmuramate--alanine ligase